VATDHQTDCIEEAFGASNGRLAERRGLDLAAPGYPMRPARRDGPCHERLLVHIG